MYILPIFLLCPATGLVTGAREMAEGQAAAAGRAGQRPVGLACGPVQAAPLGCHTRANLHELASNNKCTLTCCCRAC